MNQKFLEFSGIEMTMLPAEARGAEVKGKDSALPLK
jgi:hypothetical protein